MKKNEVGLILAVLIETCMLAPQCGNRNNDPDTDVEQDAGQDAGTPDTEVCASGPERNGPYTIRVTVVGDTGTMGLIDPSVEYAATADTGLMTYTSVPTPQTQHISIAASNDNGASWDYVSDVTPPGPSITVTTTDNTICGSSSCSGTWTQESSSLIIDTSDPDPSRVIKVFAHTYFYAANPIGEDDDEARRFEIGYLSLYTASSAEGPWTETPLFGWPSSSSISNENVVYDISTNPAMDQLRDCVIVGEPGALVRSSGTIDLALSCPMDNDKTDIRLLRSTDHSMTWTFVSTLLTTQDGLTLGSEKTEITGGDLFYADGAYHLIATPFGTVNTPNEQFYGYRGCVVVSIADLDAGRVARCNEAPVVEASYLGQPGQFVGACSTDAGATASGMLIPVPDLTGTTMEIFQLFASGLSIP